MTISHTKPGTYINRSIRVLLLLLPISCLAVMFLYSGSGAARAELSERSQEVEALTAMNTELKNNLQVRTDNRALTMQVERLGYIKESHPTYVTLFADGSVIGDEQVSLR